MLGVPPEAYADEDEGFENLHEVSPEETRPPLHVPYEYAGWEDMGKWDVGSCHSDFDTLQRLVQLVTLDIKIETSEHVGTPSARVRETFSTQPENQTLFAADAAPDDDEDEQAWNGLGKWAWGSGDVGGVQTINMYHYHNTSEYITIIIFLCMSIPNDSDAPEQD